MASVVHRINKIYMRSVNTPDFPAAAWVINSAEADTLFSAGVPSKYWNIVVNLVTEMSVAEKAAVDAALIIAENLEFRNEAIGLPVERSGLGVQTISLIELSNKRSNFNTTRIIELQDRVQAMLDSAGNLNAMKAAGLAVPISATATRPRSAAVAAFIADINSGLNDPPDP